MTHRSCLAALLGALLFAAGAHAARPSIDPPQPLLSLSGANYTDIYANNGLLTSLGGSARGIKLAIEENRWGLADGLPPELTKEPGLSQLAAAVEAYYLMYPGVDMACRTAAWAAGADSLANQVPRAAGFARPNTYFPVDALVEMNKINNGGTMYGAIMYSLKEGPILINLPPSFEGYWVMEVMDFYYENMASEGTRTGAKAGDSFLLVPSGAGEEVAADSGGATVIELPNEDGLVVFRVRRSDPGAADFLLGINVTDPDGGEPWQPGTWNLNYTDCTKSLPAVGGDPLYFWRSAGEVLQANPEKAREPLLYRMSRLGITPERGLDLGGPGVQPHAEAALRAAPPIAAQFMEAAYNRLGRPEENYWQTMAGLVDQRWGAEPLTGAAVIKYFWLANYLEDAAYYLAFLDGEGLPLRGNLTYRLDFPGPPPANPRAFYSLTVLNAADVTYPNPDDWLAYNIGYNAGTARISSLSAATNRTASGAFSIILSPDQPAELGQEGINWLPVPWPDAPITLNMRVYWPEEEVIAAEYVPPKVNRA